MNIIDTFLATTGKTKETTNLLKTNKVNPEARVLLVVSAKDENVRRATNNLNQVKVVSAMFLNVFDILNADIILLEKTALEIVKEWLAVRQTPEKKATKEVKAVQ